VRDYTNSEIQHIIDEWIHSKKDREILHLRLIDGLTIEELAERFDRSPRQMQRIVNRLQTIVFLHISL
jgi:DNA-directed RNA polymerase specialized sigma24 family protein